MHPTLRRRWLSSYLLLLPSSAVLALVFFYALWRVGIVSLHTGALGNEGPSTLDNFRLVLTDPIFRTAVKDNALLMLTVPVTTVFSLVVAILLNERLAGWRAFRTIIFLPYVLSIPVLGTTFVYLYTLNGVLNVILRDIGLGVLAQDWIGNPSLALPSIASIIVYHELGFGAVLFLARLLSVPAELGEAARIDGANWWQVHRHVTLPQMRSIIQTLVILELITVLSSIFAYVYTTTKGGPNFSTYILELYIYDNAFTFRSPGLAAAVAVMLLAASTVFIALLLRRRTMEVAGD